MRERKNTNLYFAVDPGPEENGFVVVRNYLHPEYTDWRKPNRLHVVEAGRVSFPDLREIVKRYCPLPSPYAFLVVEFPCFYKTAKGGGPLLRTAEVCGRLREFWRQHVSPHEIDYSDFQASRPDVVRALVGSNQPKSTVKARVKEIWADYFEMPSRDPIGTKKDPGPLYGMKAATGDHHWDALALLTASLRNPCILRRGPA